jgi:hypothetical protein
MTPREEKREKCFSQMRLYIARHLLGIGSAAVVVVTLCVGWPVYHGVAQTNDAPADATLTVGQCIGANGTIDPLKETLINEGVIEENLLQTKVTNGMCEDMLAPIADGTPTRKLLASQNYMQEIKLIERSMHEAAADEAATSGTDANGPDHHYLADKPFVLPRWTVLGATEEGSTDGGGIGELNVEPAAYLQDVVQGQYDDGGGGGGVSGGGGASATQAAAGGRCSLEVDVLDEEVDKIKGLYEIRPLMPKKMWQGETEDAGLVVSPVTKERFGEIRQQHRDIAEASKSHIGCVRLTDRMKATLSPWYREELVIDRHHPDDIRKLSSNRAATWNWDVTARQAGKLELHLLLRYAISRKNLELRSAPQSPIYEGAIEATPPESDPTQKDTERPWWRRVLEGIFNRISGLFAG